MLALCLIIPCAFMLSACDKSELSTKFSTEWTYDADNHWHEANSEDIDIVLGLATHIWIGGVVISSPTETSAGQTKYIYQTRFTFGKNILLGLIAYKVIEK